MASVIDRGILETGISKGITSGTQPWPLGPLFESMAQAARQGDREMFDQIFDCCFAWVYAVSWRLTGHVARAEAITAQVLREGVIDVG